MFVLGVKFRVPLLPLARMKAQGSGPPLPCLPPVLLSVVNKLPAVQVVAQEPLCAVIALNLCYVRPD